LEQQGIEGILSHYHPSEIYNYAAYSSGSGMFDYPVEIGDVNGLAVARILEAIYKVNVGIRFCQASSSEMFGNASTSPQSETTPFCPRTPYGSAKLYAHSMIGIYRQRYNIFACSAILYNHESPRRGLNFVTKKITHEVVKIKLGLSNKLQLGNLDARRDWGFAGDYVRGMWLMLQQKKADDFILATGETHSVRDLCESAFGHLGLNYRDYVEMNDSDCRPVESVQLVGDIDKAKRILKWVPEIGFHGLIQLMIDADIQSFEN